MVEATPTASLKMTEPDLLLEVLIIALDAPAQLGQIDKTGEGEPLRVCRRLHSLRGWSHEQAEDPAEVFAGGA